jgi:hypothetical protein
MDTGVDLRIAQLLKEGMIRTTWPRIHPHGDHPLAERLDLLAEKGSQEVHARQPFPP